jgi:phosphoenolpyruvate carboxykinase (GTP)
LWGNTVFTNVALTDDGDVWWEGLTKEKPAHLTDWTGHDWTPESGTPAAHPNSRFTVAIDQCPTTASDWADPRGVVVDAIVFGGRRSDTMPLVTEARSWSHGVYLGATMASERTAAAEGALGELRRDPFAMAPFTGYNVGDHWAHWLSIGERLRVSGRFPRIFQVNWFRKNAEGKFVWPGFGDNMRVLKWVVERCSGTAHANKTALGYAPDYADLHWQGISFDTQKFENVTAIDQGQWKAELGMHDELFKKLEGFVPDELLDNRKGLEGRLAA